MKVDFGLRPTRSMQKDRREHMWRVARAIVGSMVAGAAGLIFGFVMGLHDARWSDVWMRVGYASSAFSTQADDLAMSRG